MGKQAIRFLNSGTVRPKAIASMDVPEGLLGKALRVLLEHEGLEVEGLELHPLRLNSFNVRFLHSDKEQPALLLEAHGFEVSVPSNKEFMGWHA